MRPAPPLATAALLLCATFAGAAAPPAWKPGEYRRLLGDRDRLLKRIHARARAGELEDALAPYKRLLDMEAALFGTHSPEVADSLDLLARIHEGLEDLPAVIRTRGQALAAWLACRPAGHWRVTDARLALGDARRMQKLTAAQRHRLLLATQLNMQLQRLGGQGKPSEALKAGREALAIREELLGPKHRDTAQILANLGVMHTELGEYKEALALHERALAVRRELLGEDHPQTANSLHNLASLLNERGEWATARRHQERAQAIVRNTLGEDHPAYAAGLNNLAGMLDNLGEYRQARALYEQALALLARTKGEADPHHLTCMVNLARMHIGLGQADRAREMLGRARRLFEESKHHESEGYATCLSLLARLDAEEGAFDRAARLYAEARDITRAGLGVRHRRYASSVKVLAHMEAQRGNFPAARKLFRQTAELIEKHQGKKHPAYTEARLALARLERDAGDTDRALELMEEVLAWVRENVGEKTVHHAVCLNELAELRRARGELGKARELAEQTLAAQEKLSGPRHPSTLNAAGNLARLYRELGDLERSAELYDRTIEASRQVRGQRHPDHVTLLINRATLHLSQEEPKAAARLLQSALALMRARLGEKHHAVATVLNNLAGAHGKLGDHETSQRLGEEACKVLAATVGEKHPHHALALHALALHHLRTGDAKAALRLAERSAAIRKEAQGEKHRDHAESLLTAAWAEHELGRSRQAEARARKAMGHLRDHLDSVFAALAEQQQIDLLDGLRHNLGLYLFLADAAGTPAETRYEQVLAWKAVAARYLAERQLARDEPELAPLLGRLREARAALAGLAASPPAPAAQKEWAGRLRELEDRKEALQVELARKSTSFARRDPTPARVSKAVPAGAVLVDLVEHVIPAAGKNRTTDFEKRLTAFVVLAGKSPVHVDLGPARPIDEAVLAWRKPLLASPPGALDAKAAAELRRLVWRPLAKHLAGASAVLIAPDGALALLPLAALPGEKPGTFLIEEAAFARLTSAAQLLDPVGKFEADGLLAVGGLSYGDDKAGGETRRTSWAALPGTRLEAERVARLFRERFPKADALVLAGTAADRARVVRELTPGKEGKRRRYLHLATHGYFGPEQAGALYRRHPLLASGLALAGANRDPANGSLSAEEASALDLRGCELVVLSACETGLGRLQAGEGVLGLERAFQVAGARALLTSLWSVSDPATSVLMEEFYNRLWGEKKVTKLEALRQAQLHVLNNPDKVNERAKELRVKAGDGVPLRGVGKKTVVLPEGAKADGKRSHPAWWAAFVLSGR